MCQQFFDDCVFDLRRFVASVQLLLYSVLPFLKRRQICKHELSINHFNVADWIDCRADMMNIAVFETAHHLHDGIDLANVMQKLITKPFPRTRALDQTGNIHKLNGSRRDFF